MAKTTGGVLFFFALLSLSFNLTFATDDAYPTVSGCSSPSDQVPKPIRREVYGGGRIFDISHRYSSDMPSYDTEDGKLGQFLSLPQNMKNGSIVNISELKIIAHSGTHVDAPGHVFDHYFDAGYDVDTLDLEVLNGNNFCVQVGKYYKTWSCENSLYLIKLHKHI